MPTKSVGCAPFLIGNFGELRQHEVRRIFLPRTSVNKDRKKGQGYYTWAPFIGSEVLPPAHQRLGLLGPSFVRW
jgi:hypothetical protein